MVLTRNEYKTAERLREDYWLYVVFDCTTTPRLVPIRDPVRLGWQPIARVEHYQIGPEQVDKQGLQSDR